MDQQITLRVRPGESVRFPGRCVACGRPAGERMDLTRRRGQITRRLAAPLCEACARQLARRSGQEERLLRLRWVAAAAVAALLAVLALVALPVDPWWLRLVVGLAIGLPGGAFIFWALTRRAEAAELPERRAVREAAQIVDFTWRDMTLAFANPRVMAEVVALNPGAVSEGAPAARAAPVAESDIEEAGARETAVSAAEETSVLPD